MVEVVLLPITVQGSGQSHTYGKTCEQCLVAHMRLLLMGAEDLRVGWGPCRAAASRNFLAMQILSSHHTY